MPMISLRIIFTYKKKCRRSSAGNSFIVPVTMSEIQALPYKMPEMGKDGDKTVKTNRMQ